jgi:hypothetical protein
MAKQKKHGNKGFGWTWDAAAAIVGHTGQSLDALS